MNGSYQRAALLASALLAPLGSPLFAGAHTWDVNEIFSNADGTIQFIELQEANGTAGETGVGNGFVTSNTRSFDIPANVVAPTTFKFLLFATPAFAALAGAPTPDHIFPAGSVPFFNINGDTIRYTPYDTRTFGVGVLPTDGVRSINKLLVSQVNSPTNYAGQTGSVNVGPPAGVPDGQAGSTPMTVTKVNPAGANLSIHWDVATCGAGTNHHIVFGDKSQLPTTAGGAFAVGGGVCNRGTASPISWTSVPDAADSSGLVWWVLVALDFSTTEGSWGESSSGVERLGPAAGGSSGVCGVTGKSLANACGH